MNIRGIVAGVVVGLLVGGGTLSAAHAGDTTDQPSLRCETVPDCQVVIDELYSTAKQLGAETNDLRVIRDKQDKRIARLEGRVSRLKDRLADRR